MTVQLFDQSNLATLDWPATGDGDYARRYLQPFIENGPQTYIRNVRTTLMVLQMGATLLPITTSEFNLDNSYICSPYNHYISYGQEEFRNLNNPLAERLLRALFIPIGAYFRRNQFDRVVFVNNWLLSTNLYPVVNPEQIVTALRYLITRFPDRAIVFRSVDAYRNAVLQDTLQAHGCRLVFSRQVYYQDVFSKYVQRKQQFRFDLKHFQRTPYTVVDGADLPPAAPARVVDLYADLYLRKYSYYNPQFTEAFIRLALVNRLLNIKVFMKDGQIDAVMGCVSRQGVSTPPLFGYDTHLPQSLGLYRLLSTLTSLEAQRQNLQVHFSAGVGQFKRLRGGVPVIEYNAIYDAHLPAARRRPWALLQFLMERLAVPIIQKYGF